MAEEDSHSIDSSDFGDEGQSDPLRVATEARARLSTPPKVAIFREQTNPTGKSEMFAEQPIQMSVFGIDQKNE